MKKIFKLTKPAGLLITILAGLSLQITPASAQISLSDQPLIDACVDNGGTWLVYDSNPELRLFMCRAYDGRTPDAGDKVIPFLEECRSQGGIESVSGDTNSNFGGMFYVYGSCRESLISN